MTVSLVIPAYNEGRRLPTFLEELVTFSGKTPGTFDEVMVVDDGSTDRTSDVARMFTDLLPLHLLRLPENRGKGAAVRAGVRASRGDVMVFMDADGATAPGEIPKLLAALEHAPIAVGNRWMAGSQVNGQEPFRAFSSWVYRTYMGFFGLRDVDTMCGFKGFHRHVAQALFEPLKEERWLFDTEIMLRARRQKHRITNVPISWTSKHGSKLGLAALIRSSFWIPAVAARVATESLSTRPPQ